MPHEHWKLRTLIKQSNPPPKKMQEFHIFHLDFLQRKNFFCAHNTSVTKCANFPHQAILQFSETPSVFPTF